MLNLINHQLDTDKIYVCTIDLYKAKYQFLINKCEKVDLKYYNDPKAFTEYLNDIQHVYKNIDDRIQIKNLNINRV